MARNHPFTIKLDAHENWAFITKANMSAFLNKKFESRYVGGNRFIDRVFLPDNAGLRRVIQKSEAWKTFKKSFHKNTIIETYGNNQNPEE